MEDPEWHYPAAMLIVRGALVTNDFNEVVEVTTGLLEKNPDDALALLYRAQANAYWKKDHEAASPTRSGCSSWSPTGSKPISR